MTKPPPTIHLGHEPDSLLPPRWRTACQRRRVPEVRVTLDADDVTCVNCRRSRWWPILTAMGPGAEPTWHETAGRWRAACDSALCMLVEGPDLLEPGQSARETKSILAAALNPTEKR